MRRKSQTLLATYREQWLVYFQRRTAIYIMTALLLMTTNAYSSGTTTPAQDSLAAANETVKTLIGKLSGVAPDDVERYDKATEERTFCNVMLFLGALDPCTNEIQQVKKQGAEKVAVSAIIELLKAKQNLADKADHITCIRALGVLKEFIPLPQEAIPLLEQLRTHKSSFVQSRATELLKQEGAQRGSTGAAPSPPPSKESTR